VFRFLTQEGVQGLMGNKLLPERAANERAPHEQQLNMPPACGRTIHKICERKVVKSDV